MRLALALLLASAALVAAGCSTFTNSASGDPMKCERDPKCDKKRTRVFDCSTQCNDDPACMERCETVQAPNGGLGH
jgi:hypothetical protein